MPAANFHFESMGIGDLLRRQPTAVTSTRKAVLPDGRPMLDLELEGSLHFPVTFPAEAIPLLQKALSELQEMTKSAAKGPPHH